MGKVKANVEIVDVIASELIRQVFVHCSERGILLQKVLAMMHDTNKVALGWHQEALLQIEKQREKLKDRNNLITNLQEALQENEDRV